jgi:hypothetical protein
VIRYKDGEVNSTNIYIKMMGLAAEFSTGLTVVPTILSLEALLASASALKTSDSL